MLIFLYLCQVLAASACLFSRAIQFSHLNSTVREERLAHEAVKGELLAAQGRIARLEANCEVSQAELMGTRERATLSEATCTRTEAELVATRERAIKLEADGEAAHLRAEAE